MAVLILIVMASLLIGAVLFGFLRNSKKGKPGAGRDAAGTARKSS